MFKVIKSFIASQVLKFSIALADDTKVIGCVVFFLHEPKAPQQLLSKDE